MKYNNQSAAAAAQVFYRPMAPDLLTAIGFCSGLWGFGEKVWHFGALELRINAKKTFSTVYFEGEFLFAFYSFRKNAACFKPKCFPLSNQKLAQTNSESLTFQLLQFLCPISSRCCRARRRFQWGRFRNARCDRRLGFLTWRGMHSTWARQKLHRCQGPLPSEMDRNDAVTPLMTLNSNMLILEPPQIHTFCPKSH